MTIIYIKGGNVYLGEFKDRKISYWKKYRKTKYMYKGYRYYGGKKDSVVVYDDVVWNMEELQRRKRNGFLGIREYKGGYNVSMAGG